jgi:CheY-like chemotaxis protein
MPVILVVDDSPLDRALIGELIKDQPLDWVVDFAESAEEALVRISHLAVDLVVTDMNMPGMDGLELLGLLRKRYSGLPVIRMTGQGNESLAVAALRSGAASYVPKAEFASRLVETIKQVLQVIKSERNYDQLIENVSNMRFEFQLDNDPEMIAPLVSLVQQMASRLRLCGDEGCRQIGVALDEAMINAIYHGNLQLPRESLNEVRGRLRDEEDSGGCL